MLADLDDTLRQLLTAEIPIRNSEIDVKFDQPKREWSARLSKPTINLFLYDIRENVVLKRQQVDMTRHDGRTATQQRSAYRVDFTYMLTCWAAQPEDEHRLMSRTLQALFQFPTLPASRLRGKLRRQSYPVPLQLARHDKLTNPAELWSALDNELRPATSLIVTLALNPWEEVTGPAVQLLTMRMGFYEFIPDEEGHVRRPLVYESHVVAGVVRLNDEPVRGARVAFKGTGYIGTTDEQGRFRLGAILRGEYTLVVWHPDSSDQPPQERPLTVPAPDGNYDMVLDGAVAGET
jgi:hypothetical protein